MKQREIQIQQYVSKEVVVGTSGHQAYGFRNPDVIVLATFLALFSIGVITWLIFSVHKPVEELLAYALLISIDLTDLGFFFQPIRRSGRAFDLRKTLILILVYIVLIYLSVSEVVTLKVDVVEHVGG